MNTLKLALVGNLLCFATIASLAAVASAAATQQVVPPDNSSVSQYTETYPEAFGNTTIGDKGKPAHPTQILGGKNARRLEAMGSEGQATATLAAETSASPTTTSRSHLRTKARDHHGSEGRAPASRAELKGSSGLLEVIRQATGVSSTTQTGILAPLLIAVAIFGSMVYLWRRRSPAA